MNLRDLDIIDFNLGTMQFDGRYSLPCAEFQKNLRDLSIIDTNLNIYINNNIESTTKPVILHVEGAIGEQIFQIDTSSEYLDEIGDLSTLTKIGMYNLAHLNLFFKASSICTNIELFLKENDLLILKFKVANIGCLEFLLPQLLDKIKI